VKSKQAPVNTLFVRGSTFWHITQARNSVNAALADVKCRQCYNFSRHFCKATYFSLRHFPVRISYVLHRPKYNSLRVPRTVVNAEVHVGRDGPLKSLLVSLSTQWRNCKVKGPSASAEGSSSIEVPVASRSLGEGRAYS